jgi:1-aminocyclopropane-1-carboxylate deaminase
MDELSMNLSLAETHIDTVSLYKSHTKVDVLRLDVIHPVISGNKWFKLKEYLRDAQSLKKQTVLTYGGAYSNHIIATAAVAKSFGLESIGIIKNYQPKTLSHTLQQAHDYGMRIYFAPSEKELQNIVSNIDINTTYEIPLGCYGKLGKAGAKTILESVPLANYTHIICAVGTGTMLAGLTEAALPKQMVLGISSMKNNLSLGEEIRALLPENLHGRFMLIHDYHFGGFAKYSSELIQFMNWWYKQTSIPSDFVYTGKLFYAVNDLIMKNYFSIDSKILVIHSGGLQGNASLSKGTLIF